jgi:hypothetical protein
LNNILEQDHRAIKRRVKAKQGFREYCGLFVARSRSDFRLLQTIALREIQVGVHCGARFEWQKWEFNLLEFNLQHKKRECWIAFLY